MNEKFRYFIIEEISDRFLISPIESQLAFSTELKIDNRIFYCLEFKVSKGVQEVKSIISKKVNRIGKQYRLIPIKNKENPYQNKILYITNFPKKFDKEKPGQLVKKLCTGDNKFKKCLCYYTITSNKESLKRIFHFLPSIPLSHPILASYSCIDFPILRFSKLNIKTTEESLATYISDNAHCNVREIEFSKPGPVKTFKYANVLLQKVEDIETVILKFNFSTIDGNEIYVTQFLEPDIGMEIKKYEVAVFDLPAEIKDNEFFYEMEKFGRIFDFVVDHHNMIGYVTFIFDESRQKLLQSKKYNARYSLVSIIITNFPPATTSEDVLQYIEETAGSKKRRKRLKASCEEEKENESSVAKNLPGDAIEEEEEEEFEVDDDFDDNRSGDEEETLNDIEKASKSAEETHQLNNNQGRNEEAPQLNNNNDNNGEALNDVDQGKAKNEKDLNGAEKSSNDAEAADQLNDDQDRNAEAPQLNISQDKDGETLSGVDQGKTKSGSDANKNDGTENNCSSEDEFAYDDDDDGEEEEDEQDDEFDPSSIKSIKIFDEEQCSESTFFNLPTFLVEFEDPFSLDYVIDKIKFSTYRDSIVPYAIRYYPRPKDNYSERSKILTKLGKENIILIIPVDPTVTADKMYEVGSRFGVILFFQINRKKDPNICIIKYSSKNEFSDAMNGITGLDLNGKTMYAFEFSSDNRYEYYVKKYQDIVNKENNTSNKKEKNKENKKDLIIGKEKNRRNINIEKKSCGKASQLNEMPMGPHNMNPPMMPHPPMMGPPNMDPRMMQQFWFDPHFYWANFHHNQPQMTPEQHQYWMMNLQTMHNFPPYEGNEDEIDRNRGKFGRGGFDHQKRNFYSGHFHGNCCQANCYDSRLHEESNGGFHGKGHRIGDSGDANQIQGECNSKFQEGKGRRVGGDNGQQREKSFGFHGRGRRIGDRNKDMEQEEIKCVEEEEEERDEFPAGRGRGRRGGRGRRSVNNEDAGPRFGRRDPPFQRGGRGANNEDAGHRFGRRDPPFQRGGKIGRNNEKK